MEARPNISFARLLVILAVGLVLTFTAWWIRAHRTPAEKGKLYLLWEPQAQFLGYYVAEELGFYKEAGMDLTIHHSLAVGDSIQEVSNSSNTYFNTLFINIVDWLSHGPPVQLISVVSRGCNLGWMASVPTSPPDLAAHLNRGMIFTWWGGHDVLLRTFLGDTSLADKAFEKRVTSNYPVHLEGPDTALVMRYNEIFDFPMPEPEIAKHFISYCDVGLPVFEDVLVGPVADTPEKRSRHHAIAQATWRGWDWAEKHPQQAIDILMRKRPRRAREHQERQFRIFRKSLVSSEEKPADFPGVFKTIEATLSQKTIQRSQEIDFMLRTLHESPSARFLSLESAK